MKFLLNHTILLILTVNCCINTYAAIDSLPPRCIKNLNIVQSDTIEIEKIITLRTITLDTIVKKPYISPAPVLLPDTIAKLAFQKNSGWIEESSYDGKFLYRFQNATDKPISSKITFAGSYYNENGKEVIPGKWSGGTAWWHLYQGKFSRTQFRPGYK